MRTAGSFKTTEFTYEATQCYKHKYHNLSPVSYILNKYTLCDRHRWTALHIEEITTVVFSFLIIKKSASRQIPCCTGSSYQRRHVGITGALYLRGPEFEYPPKDRAYPFRTFPHSFQATTWGSTSNQDRKLRQQVLGNVGTHQSNNMGSNPRRL